MYKVVFWDKKSKVNGVSPEFVLKDFKNPNERFYLINDENGNTSLIQTESMRPYMDLSFEECAKKQCEEMNRELLDEISKE